MGMGSGIGHVETLHDKRRTTQPRLEIPTARKIRQESSLGDSVATNLIRREIAALAESLMLQERGAADDVSVRISEGRKSAYRTIPGRFASTFLTFERDIRSVEPDITPQSLQNLFEYKIADTLVSVPGPELLKYLTSKRGNLGGGVFHVECEVTEDDMETVLTASRIEALPTGKESILREAVFGTFRGGVGNCGDADIVHWVLDKEQSEAGPMVIRPIYYDAKDAELKHDKLHLMRIPGVKNTTPKMRNPT